MPTSPRRSSSTNGPIRLSLAHETGVCVVLAGLVVSGALWLVYHYLVPRGEVMATNPIESWSLRVHGGLAMVALILLGTLLLPHALGAWQRGLSRGSGGLMLGAMLFLTITGYLLYYASSEGLRDATSWLHWGAGLAIPVLLIVHLQRGGRFTRAAPPRDDQSR